MGLIQDSLVSNNLEDYTVEADFSMNSANNMFGLQARGNCLFIWRMSNWAFYGPGISKANYDPALAYVPGAKVHLKVVCGGNTVNCYIDKNDGKGEITVFSIQTDNTLPVGGTGFFSYVSPGETAWAMDNFKVSGCGAVAMTPTVTQTPTITPTPRSTVETQYQYDRNGNLIRETVRQRYNSPQTTRYYYDYENRLRRVVPPTRPAINYRYDYAGNLVERRVDIYRGDVVRYVYGAGVEPLAQQENGQWTNNVVVNGKVVESFRRAYGNIPNNKLFYHTDALGSVVALSERGGRVVRTTEYDP